MIKKRQKLVQLADSSELGWRVVAEYETNPIASDSDDEKKMYKAEARAARKVNFEKSKIRRGRAFPYRRQRQVPDTPSPSGVMQRNRRPGLCFTCGKPGHWKMECNQNSSNSNIKLSRSNSCMFCKCKDSKFDTNIEKLSVAGKKTSQNEMSDIQRRSTNGTVDGVYGSFDQSLSCANTSFNDTGHSSTDSLNIHDTHCVQNVHNINVQNCDVNETPLTDSQKVGAKPSPVGRLKKHVSEWKNISDNVYIIGMVPEGYKLPFKEIPPKVNLKNNRSARENPEFVCGEINSLLQKGVISEVNEKAYVVNCSL
ncbi:uncharacterized protein LOC128557630 [Mercenaria mercenaria]|uniref:uncharacterized protein LOC128557630 n=1 Tax=Mercenaria mercenaria TaxID=6596 RepID=UPI00234F8A1E|nr:uncharacterized protein LOC128557630 [Mercenaria mercenaria]XP_053401281.1 uncharacterized protein LOC128557630 [Mercenaria mercenaria]